MQRILCAMVFILLAATPLRAQEQRPSQPQGPQITFERTVHNFGRIPYKGEPQTTEFRFTNTGDAPLVILRTELTCTCLSSDYPKRPVAPGHSGTITVTYTPKKDFQEFRNAVRVVANTELKKHTLFVEGEVVRK